MNTSFFRGPAGLVSLGLVSVTACALLLLPTVGHGFLQPQTSSWIDDYGDGGGGGTIDWHTTGNTTTGSEVLGTLNPMPLSIVTNGVAKMNVLPGGGVNVLTTPPFANDLTLGTGNSLSMPQGFWDGSGTAPNPFALELAMGDVDVMTGDLLMPTGFWDGSGSSGDPFSLELTSGNVNVAAGNVNVMAGAINMPLPVGGSWNALGLGDLQLGTGSMLKMELGTWDGGTGILTLSPQTVGPALLGGNLLVDPIVVAGNTGGNVIIGTYLGAYNGLTNHLMVTDGSVGIGTVDPGAAAPGTPRARLDIQGAPATPELLLRVEGVGNFPSGGPGAPGNHIAYFNSLPDAAGNADGLLIQLAVSPSSPAHNFITFFDTSGTLSVGAIQGPPAGGVLCYSTTAGSDFAEGLPKLFPEENIEPGMIVGVYGGYITKDTVGADHIMVISTAPGFLGGSPPEDEADNYGIVAFMGRVPVLVRAPASSGDYIMASGMGDGTAVAVSPGDIGFDDIGSVVGTAWSDLEGGLLGYVTVVVGVNSAVSGAQALSAHTGRVQELQAELDRTQSKLADMSRRMAQLESAIAD